MKSQTYSAWLLIAALGVLSAPVRAGEVDVIGVTAKLSPAGTYRFDVTLVHGDEGWDHYADGWEIRDGEGTVLARRVLAHPHVNEQPFTRGLGGVKLPASLRSVTVAGHDSVHGYGGIEMTIELPAE